MVETEKLKIFKLIKRIHKSGLTFSKFAEIYPVPFSRAQYFRYRNCISLNGFKGLKDNRRERENRVFSSEVVSALKAYTIDGFTGSLEELQTFIYEQLSCNVSISAISKFMKKLGLPIRSVKLKQKNDMIADQVTSLGGFELIIAIACYLELPKKTCNIIHERIKFLNGQDQLKVRNPDIRYRKKGGKFSKKLNKLKHNNHNKFASIKLKRVDKNWYSVNILRDSAEVIKRKTLAVLSLPVITMNGSVRTSDSALGQELIHISGFNYSYSTLRKYLSELKYLGVSNDLLLSIPSFWRDVYGKEQFDENLPLLCYYVDGNTKPVWSSYSIKKNKVTMLGRVMGCLEQVFIHDGLGRPIYFETYSGHGPVGEKVLGLFEKINDRLIDTDSEKSNVYRAIVLDSASNSVKNIRQFLLQKTFYFITLLDDNQIKSKKFSRIDAPCRYEFGAANLYEVEIELEDSTDKKYLIRARAIKIEWDTGKITMAITNLPKNIIDASKVVHSYFKRWPAQECQFKAGKAVASLNRVAGYGRQLVSNPQARLTQEKLKKAIENLTDKLIIPLNELDFHSEKALKLEEEERQIFNKCLILQGKRVVPIKQQKGLNRIQKELKQERACIAKIKKNNKPDLSKLDRNRRKWVQLLGKDKIYQIDVELDQIMTYHRVCLMQLYSYFFKNFLNDTSMSMVTFVHKYLHLKAIISETASVRTISLQKNSKDFVRMHLLELAINKINALKIIGPHNKVMFFTFS